MAQYHLTRPGSLMWTLIRLLHSHVLNDDRSIRTAFAYYSTAFALMMRLLRAVGVCYSWSCAFTSEVSKVKGFFFNAPHIIIKVVVLGIDEFGGGNLLIDQRRGVFTD